MNISLDFGPEVEMTPGVQLRLTLPAPLTDAQLFDVCQRNDCWRFEREANGDLSVRAPRGGATGLRIGALNVQLANWDKDERNGVSLGSNVGVYLPGGVMRSPGAAWVCSARWNELTGAQREGFLPFCPDFVAEVLSPFDRRSEYKGRMAEYRAGGARLGWLFDPQTREVHIYRPGQPVSVLSNPAEVSADPELPGFVLRTQRIF